MKLIIHRTVTTNEYYETESEMKKSEYDSLSKVQKNQLLKSIMRVEDDRFTEPEMISECDYKELYYPEYNPNDDESVVEIIGGDE